MLVKGVIDNIDVTDLLILHKLPTSEVCVCVYIYIYIYMIHEAG